MLFTEDQVDGIVMILDEIRRERRTYCHGRLR